MSELQPASPRERLNADAVLLAATVGWALTFAAVKDALNDASPSAFLAARFALGAAVAALFARRQLADRPSLRGGAILGLLLWLGFALNTWGLHFTTATRSGFVTSLCVVLVPFASALLLRRRIHPAAWLGATLAGAGLTLMSARALTGEGGGLLGDGLTLASTLAYTAHIMVTEHFAPRTRPLPTVTAQLTVVAVLSAASLPFEQVRFTPTPWLLGTLVFTGVCASFLFITMQLWAQARTTAVRASLIFSLEPVLAAVFSYFIVHDPLVPETLAGGAFIVAGIVTAELWPRLEARRAPPAAPHGAAR